MDVSPNIETVSPIANSITSSTGLLAGCDQDVSHSMI